MQECDKAAAEGHYRNFLISLGFDVDSNPHMENTPHRVVKMFCDEVFSGLYTDPPNITMFGGSEATEIHGKPKKSDLLLVTSGPLTLRSMCAHHMMPIYGTAFVGVLLDKRYPLPGLSKYARIVNHYARRPQTQEFLGDQIVDHLVGALGRSAVGVAVTLRATHMCMTHRGVNEHASSMMITNHIRGKFLKSSKLLGEYTSLCQAHFR